MILQKLYCDDERLSWYPILVYFFSYYQFDFINNSISVHLPKKKKHAFHSHIPRSIIQQCIISRYIWSLYIYTSQLFRELSMDNVVWYKWSKYATRWSWNDFSYSTTFSKFYVYITKCYWSKLNFLDYLLLKEYLFFFLGSDFIRYKSNNNWRCISY